uniref:PBPe domain-containing protein n=1 Tax=Mesocestoides corti TaxID=53468 RepID=A0A5K3EV18_MESCO
MTQILKLTRSQVRLGRDYNKRLHSGTEPLQFLGSGVGQFQVYYKREFPSSEEILSRILVDGATVLVLKLDQSNALKLLTMAQEKNILLTPFHWLVFNAGLTLSGNAYDVADANFYAVELSTNGKFQDYPEFNSIPKPVTTNDLIFRDMTVVALKKLSQLLAIQLTEDVPLITCTLSDPNLSSQELTPTWNFYSYVTTEFDASSTYRIERKPNGTVDGNFQPLKPTPTRESLLKLMQSKPFRIGTFVIPPLIELVDDQTNRTTRVQGPQIAVATKLLERLNVSFEITVFDLEVGEKVGDRWTGLFGHLEEWDIDLLVGPISLTWDRQADFQSTSPFQSISYKFIYMRPSLSGALQIFQFVVAFDGYTWLLIFITAVVFACSLALLHKISPNTLSYSIHPSMIFVFGYLVQGVRTRPPNRASSQILIAVWWFFCLVLVIGFCANYAAYRSFTALENLPSTDYSLLHQTYYTYAYINGSNTEEIMRATLDPSIYALYQSINMKFANKIPPNRTVALEQVLNGHFALIDESPFTDYYAKKYCLETSVTLWHGTYAFYMPKLLPYYDIVEAELKGMGVDGTTEEIFKQAKKDLEDRMPTFCGATFKDQALEAMRNPLVNWSDYSIEFAAAFGIFILALIGLAIVAVIITVECCLGIYKKVSAFRGRLQ